MKKIRQREKSETNKISIARASKLKRISQFNESRNVNVVILMIGFINQ